MDTKRKTKNFFEGELLVHAIVQVVLIKPHTQVKNKELNLNIKRIKVETHLKSHYAKCSHGVVVGGGVLIC